MPDGLAKAGPALCIIFEEFTKAMKNLKVSGMGNPPVGVWKLKEFHHRAIEWLTIVASSMLFYGLCPRAC